MEDRTLDTLLATVGSKEEAQKVIAGLLVAYSGDTAFTRMVGDARFSKQSLAETAWRAAGNLLTSYDKYRPL